MPSEKVSEIRERQQTPEAILEILDRALREQIPLNVTILDLDGKPHATLNLYVEEINAGFAMMTYMAEDGDVGELIPLGMTRITKVELSEIVIVP